MLSIISLKDYKLLGVIFLNSSVLYLYFYSAERCRSLSVNQDRLTGFLLDQDRSACYKLAGLVSWFLLTGLVNGYCILESV